MTLMLHEICGLIQKCWQINSNYQNVPNFTEAAETETGIGNSELFFKAKETWENIVRAYVCKMTGTLHVK